MEGPKTVIILKLTATSHLWLGANHSVCGAVVCDETQHTNSDLVLSYIPTTCYSIIALCTSC